MTIEIIPPNSSAVVTSDECRGHSRHDDHSRHPDRYDLSVQMRADAEAAALASCHSDDMMKDSFFATQKQVSDAATSTVVGFKEAAVTAYQLQGQSVLEAAKNAAALSVQSQKESDHLEGQAISNFNLANVQATTNFNALTVQSNLNQYNILLDAQKNSSASVLLATQIAADAAAKAAECCCELKEKITAEACQTRDLINSINTQNVRDRAVRSETALAAYFAAKVAPSAPVI